MGGFLVSFWKKVANVLKKQHIIDIINVIPIKFHFGTQIARIGILFKITVKRC